MLKTMLVAGGLAVAALTGATQDASAAALGNQADVGASASAGTQLAQYFYYGRPRYYRRYYRPRYYAPRRVYRRRFYYGY